MQRQDVSIAVLKYAIHIHQLVRPAMSMKQFFRTAACPATLILRHLRRLGGIVMLPAFTGHLRWLNPVRAAGMFEFRDGAHFTFSMLFEYQWFL